MYLGKIIDRKQRSSTLSFSHASGLETWEEGNLACQRWSRGFGGRFNFPRLDKATRFGPNSFRVTVAGNIIKARRNFASGWQLNFKLRPDVGSRALQTPTACHLNAAGQAPQVHSGRWRGADPYGKWYRLANEPGFFARMPNKRERGRKRYVIKRIVQKYF